ncbi:MAG: ATP-binding protein [Candidatus Dojkabacteria bacterium]
MFQRKALEKLHEWSVQKNRKPLILRGARQVGKTTLVDMFSREFDEYIYLNLDTYPDKRIFDRVETLDNLVEKIFLEKNKKKLEGKILLFIDEIQNSSRAIHFLRYFYEEKPEFYVIAAGSLLETLMDISTSFPVGRVEYMQLNPVCFEEFLKAIGERQLHDAMNDIPAKDYTHEVFLDHFHRYTILGGMPEIIKLYKDGETIANLRSVYDGLMNSYLDDVEKYARNPSQREVIRHAITSVPFESGKRIKFHGFGNSNYRSREMGEALTLLEKAFLIRLQYPSSTVDMPVLLNRKKSPKLHFLDTGLINYYSGLQTSLLTMNDLHAAYNGILAEHIAAQELKANTIESTFWVRENKQANAEVDFIIPSNSGLIIPVEVKKGRSGTLRSLHEFIDRAPHSYAIRLYSGRLKLEQSVTRNGKYFTLLNMPYYLAGKIQIYIEWLLTQQT